MRSRLITGQIVVDGVPKGMGFMVAVGQVATAYHVVEKAAPSAIVFRADVGREWAVVGVEHDEALDAALLTLVEGRKVRLSVAEARTGARWTARCLLEGNPDLTGRVTTARRDHVSDYGREMKVSQLHVDQQPGNYRGSSGSAVVASRFPSAVIGILIEQSPHASRREAANVLYSVSIMDVLTRFGIRRFARPRRLLAALTAAVVSLVAVVAFVSSLSSGRIPDCPEPVAQIIAAQTNPMLPVARTFPAPGREPTGMTFDGTKLWISDGAYAIFAVDLNGQIINSYEPTNPTPEGITWDGQSFWLFTTNFGNIDRFRIENGKTITQASIKPPSRIVGGDLPHDLAWDGDTLWFAEQYNVYQLSRSGAVLGQFTKGKNVTGVEIEADHVWLGYDSFPDGGTVELADRSGKTRRAFSIPVFGLSALAWADGTLWALGQEKFAGRNYVYRFDVAAGLALPVTVPTPTDDPDGFASPDAQAQHPSPTNACQVRHPSKKT